MTEPQHLTQNNTDSQATDNTLSVSELFVSLQGEGQLAGVVSAFVRLAGCDLRCRWCDTDYAWTVGDGQKRSVNEIVAAVESFDCDHVVVTGGEPLIAPGLTDLLDRLSRKGYHVTLETAACQYHQVRCDLVSISPKLSNSTPADDGPQAQFAAQHESRRLNLGVIQNYIYYHNYQLKFVVRDASDLKEMQQVLDRLRGVDRNRVWLMPQARTRDEYHQYAPIVAQMAIDNRLRFSPRLQVEFWDNTRGK